MRRRAPAAVVGPRVSCHVHSVRPESTREELVTTSAESEARKALNRLHRAAEKAERELEALRGALAHAEGSDFPVEAYEEAHAALGALLDFAEEEGERLREKILHTGGLEPGRVRRG